MKPLNPTKAAKEWGKHRSELYEKMKNGELSYTLDVGRNGKERRFIDPSEMIRVFGEPEGAVSDNENQDEIRTQNTDTPEIEVYKQYIESLKSQIQEKDNLISNQNDFIANRDKQVQQLLNQLERTSDQFNELTTQLLPSPEYFDDDYKTEKPKRRWWLFGRRTEDID